MKKLLASLLLGSATFTQSQFNIAQDYNLISDGDLMKTLNNYFGCRKWQDGICLQCSQRYYFNKNGICCQVKPQCREFNTQQGVCQGCYQGYKLSNGKCVQLNYNDVNEQGCARRQNGKCVECSKRWFFTSQGVCSPVSDYCRTWSVNGRCQSCYVGYKLNNGDCQLDVSVNNYAISNPLCANWNDKICVRCAERAFKDSTGRCVQVKPECNTWDKLTGNCLSCYKGYSLLDKNCVRSDQTGPKDIGCNSWDWDKQVCISCSPRYVRINGICMSVNDSCSSWNNQGLCIACYKGYSVWNGVCVRAQQNQVKDQGCKIWDWDRQVCLQCSYRYVARNGRCVPINDSCSSWNSEGLCNSCFKGYNLSNGICVRSQQIGPKDEGCKRWDWDKQICLQCSPRFIMRNGVCAKVDDFCLAWNKEGMCTDCFKGYSLLDRVCTKVEQQGPKDQGCKRWDWDNQVCLECSNRFVFKNGNCIAVNQSCLTWDQKGACTTCYKGYSVLDGICLRLQQSGPKDLGCRSWDWDRQVCLQCSGRFIPRNGVCVEVDSNCETWNNQGLCNSCYKGYLLSSGKCVVSNLSCKTTNSNGQCASCYTGYVLYKKSCVVFSKIASLAAYYAECCPEKLAALRAQGRI